MRHRGEPLDALIGQRVVGQHAAKLAADDTLSLDHSKEGPHAHPLMDSGLKEATLPPSVHRCRPSQGLKATCLAVAR